MFGCLPLLLHLCMLMGRKAHFTKVCRFLAALSDISGTQQAFSRIPFQQQQQQQGRCRAEGDEIFMLIVAKLPTKDDKRNVMRSCQAVLSLWRARNPRRSRNQRLVHAAPRSRTGRAEGRSPFKNIYNEGLASGARQGELADTGVTSLIQPCRLTLHLPDSSISFSVCLCLRQEAKAWHESQDRGPDKLCIFPKNERRRKRKGKIKHVQLSRRAWIKILKFQRLASFAFGFGEQNERWQWHREQALCEILVLILPLTNKCFWSLLFLHVCNDDSTSTGFHGSCSAGNICCVICLCQFLVFCKTQLSLL